MGPAPEVQLIAVSKTKPVEDIIAFYKAGQRHFGENYVAELIAKAKDPVLVSMFHFRRFCLLVYICKICVAVVHVIFAADVK